MKVCAVIFLVIHTLSLAAPVGGQEKLNKLKTLYSQAPRSLFLSSKQFYEFGLSQPRPYTLILLFTPLTRTTSLYEDLITNYNKVQSCYTQSSPSFHYPIFFTIIEYTRDTETLFKSQNFTQHSTIIITNPDTLTQQDGLFHFPEHSSLKLTKFTDNSAEKILSFINLNLNLQVELKKPLADRILSLIYSLTFIFCAGLMVYQLRSVLLIPSVWFAFSMVIYFLCMSGVVYDILRTPPMFGMSQEGKTEIFMAQRKGQYAFEGFLMSFCMSLCGLCLIGLHLARNIQDKLMMKGTICLLICTLIIGLSKLSQGYKVKTSWYRPTFFPPENYISGPLINDQGNSF